MPQSTVSRRPVLAIAHPTAQRAFGRNENRVAHPVSEPYVDPISHETEQQFNNCECLYDDFCHNDSLNEIEREELEFLAQFIQGTAFYAESLEEYLGEPLEDFWQAREHAYHIVTTYLILNMNA